MRVLLGEDEQERPLARVPRDAASEGVAEQGWCSGAVERNQMAFTSADREAVRARKPFGQDRCQVAVDPRILVDQRRSVRLRQHDRFEVVDCAHRRHRRLPGQECDLADRAARHHVPDRVVGPVFGRDDDLGAPGLGDEHLVRAVTLGDDRRAGGIHPGLEGRQQAGKLFSRQALEDGQVAGVGSSRQRV